MKVTKFYQSCLLVEDGGARVLIDASGEEAGRVESFGELDVVLYTHEHADHFSADLAEKFVAAGVPVYANASTEQQTKSQLNVVESGQEFTIKNLKIKAIELPHCLMPDGSAGPQNTGYLLGDKLFHPGDGVELEGLQVDNLALPLTGPDVSMKDAYAFARQVGARLAIAIHYHTFGANAPLYANFTKRFNQPFELKVLEETENIILQ